MLSEGAFKGLGDFVKEELDSNSKYESESEVVEPANEDELAFSKLGLPQRLVDSLERHGFSSLFPFIQIEVYDIEPLSIEWIRVTMLSLGRQRKHVTLIHAIDRGGRTCHGGLGGGFGHRKRRSILFWVWVLILILLLAILFGI